jgi:hypothetical protein
MNMKKTLLQAAVLGLVVGQVSYAGDGYGAKPHSHAKAEEVVGKCMGGNSCKGKSDCGTSEHSCHGQNACKGKGWVKVTEAECKKVEGATWEKSKS